MGAHLELLAALLVDVRRAVDRELLDAGRKRNRTAHACAGALGRRHDLARGGIENPVIKRLQADADILAVHSTCPCSVLPGRRSFRPSIPAGAGPSTRSLTGPAALVSIAYSMIEATMPAPTVRPPSRMAKRSFSSIAIGTISSTSTVTLSPGITISVPSGSVTMPVTSVVRK